MKLIVGLGNPGEKYASNRHNAGFMALDEIATGYRFGPWKKRFQGYAAEGQIGVVKCILLKPATYMNESGRAVGEAMRFYKLGVDDVIVIHDELDLKPGVVRVKFGGGNAGHNGLKSISANIGNEYTRVRIGIGHPGDKALVVNYVLNDFTKDEQKAMATVFEGVARAMAKLVEGSEAAFLAEAARGSLRAPQAATKLNGSEEAQPAPAVKTGLAEAADVEALLAAASKPIKPMEMRPVPVAGNGGFGGAVSRAVVMPKGEDKPAAAPAAVAPVVNGRAAAPASDIIQPMQAPAAPPPPPAAPVNYEKPAAAQIEVKPAAAIETPAPKIDVKETVLATRQKSLGGKFKSWLHSRFRGNPLP
jgi:PTH1 family peptidyl-tRNA hydrolase